MSSNFRYMLEKELNSVNLRRYRGALARSDLERFSMSTKFEISSCHSKPIQCLCLEKIDQRYLLNGGIDGKISLYDLETYHEKGGNSVVSRIAECPLSHVGVSSVQWFPCDNGAFISTGYDGVLQIWDTSAFEAIGSFSIGEKIYASAFSSDGALVAVGLHDRSVRLCDPSCGDFIHVLSGHTSAVSCVAWSPCDEFMLASASLDGSIKFWDVRKGSYGAAVVSLDWQQDHTARTSTMFPRRSNEGKYSDTGNSPHHTIPAVQQRNQMKSFDWQKDQVARAHNSSGVLSIKFSPCGRYLVSSGNDKRVRLWTAHTGELHSTNFEFSCVSSLPFSVDIASFLDSADDVLIHPSGPYGDIALANLHADSGKPFKILKGHLGMVSAVAYRRTYNQIISTGKDGLIFLWDAYAAADRYNDRSGDHSWEPEEQWSDDDDSGNAGKYATAATSTATAGGGTSHGDDGEIIRSIPRPFIPPIVQRYIEDAAATRRGRANERVRGADSAAVTSSSSSSYLGGSDYSTHIGTTAAVSTSSRQPQISSAAASSSSSSFSSSSSSSRKREAPFDGFEYQQSLTCSRLAAAMRGLGGGGRDGRSSGGRSGIGGGRAGRGRNRSAGNDRLGLSVAPDTVVVESTVAAGGTGRTITSSSTSTAIRLKGTGGGGSGSGNGLRKSGGSSTGNTSSEGGGVGAAAASVPPLTSSGSNRNRIKLVLKKAYSSRK